MRRIAASVLACLLLLTLAAPVLACINDVDVYKQEHEFKSSYNENAPIGQPAQDEPSTGPSQSWTAPLAWMGTGGALLLGGLVVVWRRPALRG